MTNTRQSFHVALLSPPDGHGNTMRTVYDSLGRVASTIDALGYATTYGYDALGRQTSVTDPLTNTVTTAYDAEGRVIAQRGATYPVDYAYNEFGEKVSMTTYRNVNGGTGNGEQGTGNGAVQGDVTRWLRDEATWGLWGQTPWQPKMIWGLWGQTPWQPKMIDVLADVVPNIEWLDIKTSFCEAEVFDVGFLRKNASLVTIGINVENGVIVNMDVCKELTKLVACDISFFVEHGSIH